MSDGVFAIALTLLVFILDAWVVSLDRLEGVFTDQTGELIAFVLSFAVIANFCSRGYSPAGEPARSSP